MGCSFGQLSGLHLSDSEELRSSPTKVWAVFSRVVLLPACLVGVSQHSLSLTPFLLADVTPELSALFLS